MKKIFTTVITCFIALLSFSQTIKTVTESYVISESDKIKGTATYQYYEDSLTGKKIKHGSFKITNITGLLDSYSEIITGNYENGLKTGIWICEETITNKIPAYFVPGRYEPVPGNERINEKIKVITIYRKGYANGLWKLTDNTKIEKRVNSDWKLESDDNTLAIYNFKNNYFADSAYIKEIKNSEQSINIAYYDSASYCFKKVSISYSGEKKEAVYGASNQDFGFTANILLKYSASITEGDLTYKESFKGGKDKPVTYALSSFQEYTNAINAIKNKKFGEAENQLARISEKDLNSSDIEILRQQKKVINDSINVALSSIQVQNTFYETKFKEFNNTLKKDFETETNSYRVKVLLLEAGRQGDMDYEQNKRFPCWKYDKWSNAKSCFDRYSKYYDIDQSIFVFQYFEYKNAFDAEKQKVLASKETFSYNNHSYYLYKYDTAAFTKNLTQFREDYENSKKSKIQLNEEKSKDLKKQIEHLNSQNKKKILYKKYIVVFDEYMSKYEKHTSRNEASELLTTLDQISNKVVSLYSQDTTDIEAKLKDIENGDQIVSILVKK